MSFFYILTNFQSLFHICNGLTMSANLFIFGFYCILCNIFFHFFLLIKYISLCVAFLYLINFHALSHRPHKKKLNKNISKISKMSSNNTIPKLFRHVMMRQLTQLPTFWSDQLDRNLVVCLGGVLGILACVKSHCFVKIYGETIMTRLITVL